MSCREQPPVSNKDSPTLVLLPPKPETDLPGPFSSSRAAAAHNLAKGQSCCWATVWNTGRSTMVLNTHKWKELLPAFHNLCCGTAFWGSMYRTVDVMNSVHPVEARLDGQGVFCRLVITDHTFQGCGMWGAGIWMAWLSYQTARNVQPKVQSLGCQDTFWAAMLHRPVLPPCATRLTGQKTCVLVLMSVAE